jgi:hypothetical protein
MQCTSVKVLLLADDDEVPRRPAPRAAKPARVQYRCVIVETADGLRAGWRQKASGPTFGDGLETRSVGGFREQRHGVQVTSNGLHREVNGARSDR